MSARRPGISAGHSAVSWAAKRMHVEPPVHTCAPPPAPLPARVHHPIVQTTHSRWFRVIRMVMGVDNYVSVEDIGEFPQLADAILLGTRELGHARVLDARGKVVSTNGQPIERRA